jgi:hypothetical protein
MAEDEPIYETPEYKPPVITAMAEIALEPYATAAKIGNEVKQELLAEISKIANIMFAIWDKYRELTEDDKVRVIKANLELILMFIDNDYVAKMKETPPTPPQGEYIFYLPKKYTKSVTPGKYETENIMTMYIIKNNKLYHLNGDKLEGAPITEGINDPVTKELYDNGLMKTKGTAPETYELDTDKLDAISLNNDINQLKSIIDEELKWVFSMLKGVPGEGVIATISNDLFKMMLDDFYEIMEKLGVNKSNVKHNPYIINAFAKFIMSNMEIYIEFLVELEEESTELNPILERYVAMRADAPAAVEPPAAVFNPGEEIEEEPAEKEESAV